MQLLYHVGDDDVLEDFLQGRYDTRPWFFLRVQAERLSLSKGFDRLLALDAIPVTPYDHQVRAVVKVLRHMRGRAVLADEVGLGKTIEAGLIMKEYLLRGLVRSALVLTPANLVAQWRQELEDKFGITLRQATARTDWTRYDLVISSLDRAKRPDHAASIAARAWDLVVVDEAHRLKDRASLAWQLVNRLQKKYILLLTATPVQNDLSELYNLITLLKPGQLHTYATFRREFTLDRHSPRNLDTLRELIDDVMVRTARRDTFLRFPPREIRSMAAPMSEAERAFYSALLSLLRKSFAATPKAQRNVLPYMLLLRQATSHPAGSIRTLRAMQRRGTIQHVESRALEKLHRLAGQVVPGKFRLTERALHECGHHAVVFTSFKETLHRLAEHLEDRGVPAVIRFHAGLSSSARREALERFRQERAVLVSTEAGSEGLNLQFCRTVINYDLPWNPLRLEQRIGRVHRIGQTDPVRIYNLVTARTIESYILYLLNKKIDMFSKVIGELEGILINLAEPFEMRLAETFLSWSGEALQHRLKEFGAELEEAARRFAHQRRIMDSLFGAASAPLTEVATGGEAVGRE